MPGILESPTTDSAISWQTFEQECGVRPATEVALVPQRSRLMTFLHKLRLFSAPEARSHYSQHLELGALDMLARDYPYLLTRLFCG